MRDVAPALGRTGACGLWVAAILLAACGGGGGRKQPVAPVPPPVVQQPQQLTFEGGGGFFERTLPQGDFTKAAIGFSGTGAISYTSSNEQVATVDRASGAVTLIGAGEARITASITADTNYLAATSTYILQVPQPDGVPFDALIGAFGAEVTFPAWARGHEFLRSTQADCDVAQFATCLGNQRDELSATQFRVTDTSATVARDATWWLRRGTLLGSALRLAHEKFVARSGASLAGFQEKLWLVGGHGAQDNVMADVWSSSDGVFWTRMTFDGGFPPRARARLLAFDGRLWLIGGNGAGPDQGAIWLADVWSSTDGITWREETHGAAFGGRYDHAAVVFNDRMWVIGGAVDGAAPRANDAWWSTNGIDWTVATSAAAFSPRSGHTVTAMNGRLWLVAGDDGAARSDAWSSEDGAAWAQATVDAGFTPRSRHVAAVVRDQLCVTGGMVSSPTATGELWCTSDGADWTSHFGSGFTLRYDIASAELAGRWYFAGGEFARGMSLPQGGTEYYYTDDVHSWDGVFFRRHTPHARFFTGKPNLLAMNDRLYTVGHLGGGSAHPFTYVSEDGSQWNLAPNLTGSQPWERYDGGYTVHAGRLWVVGGRVPIGNGDFVYTSDVWSSTDGGTWDAMSVNGGFGWRAGHALVSYAGKLFLIGGYNGGIYLNDVFTSTDGENWTSIAGSTAFSPRSEHRVVVFNNKLWLYGGVGASGRNRDAWSSEDGINWQLESNSVPYLDWEGGSAVVHDGRVWMMGGRYYEPAFRGYAYASEVHVSSDGATFTRVDIVPRIFSPRAFAGMASAQGKLWVVGGRDRYSQRSDVWSSTDGIQWRVHVRGSMPYPMPPPNP